MSNKKNKIGKALRIARIKSDLLQEDISEKTGFSINTIGAWERGDRTPPGDHLVILIECLPEMIDELWPGKNAIMKTLRSFNYCNAKIEIIESILKKLHRQNGIDTDAFMVDGNRKKDKKNEA